MSHLRVADHHLVIVDLVLVEHPVDRLRASARARGAVSPPDGARSAALLAGRSGPHSLTHSLTHSLSHLLVGVQQRHGGDDVPAAGELLPEEDVRRALVEAQPNRLELAREDLLVPLVPSRVSE